MEKSPNESKLTEIETELDSIDAEIEKLNSRKKVLLLQKTKLKYLIAEQKNIFNKKEWNVEGFEWSSALRKNLKDAFHISDFRPHQLPAINATLSGVDCILILPTGGGKSLCFQLPALVSEGLTIVVSPLVSLMEDQMIALQKLHYPAKMLSSFSKKEEVSEIFKELTDLKSASLKLLYVTPEKLHKSKRLLSKLQNIYKMELLSRLAIDEVHCCSQWGHDFRPDYKFLGIMKKMFPKTPILGLTATGTNKVIMDVQNILNIQGCLVLRAPINRPNLFYEVRKKPTSKEQALEELYHLLQKEFKGQSGIIYTMTINDTEQLANGLRAKGLKVAPYHASLDASVRSKIHQKWIDGVYQAVIATIAFGMGIDKPDVRFVIHHCLSKSMENFYQESGRAGRDNKPSKCIVFWSFGDFFRQSTMVFAENAGLENLYPLINYCIDAKSCRRRLIAEHFEETWNENSCDRMCDNCAKTVETTEKNLSVSAKNIVTIIDYSSKRDLKLTGIKLIDLWMGKKVSNIRYDVKSSTSFSRDEMEIIVAHLLIDGFLQEDFHFTPYSTNSYLIPGPKANAGVAPSSIYFSSHKKRKISSPLADQSLASETDISKEATNGHSTTESSHSKRKKKNDSKIILDSKSKTSDIKL